MCVTYSEYLNPTNPITSTTERAVTCSDGGIPANWGEVEKEEEERGHPLALQNGGFLSSPPPPPPHSLSLREGVGSSKETEQEKRRDQRFPHQTDASRKEKRKGKGKEKKFMER